MQIEAISEILMDNLLTMQRCRSEVDTLLENTEASIKSIFQEIESLGYEKSMEQVKKLFDIQEKIAFVVFKFEYPVNDFLYNFIYDFERYDEYAARYVFGKYINK